MTIEPITTVTTGMKIISFLKSYWPHILCALLTAAVCWFVWSWFERGKEIKNLKDSLKSKQAVVDLTSDRQVREVEIGNEADEKIEALEKDYGGSAARMSPPVRSAIDSLYK